MLYTKRIVLMLLVLMVMGVNVAMAEPRENVDICHFDEEYGYWVHITVNGNSVDKHFANHDDGFPNNTTSQTGTTVDASCEERLPFCGNCLEAHGGLGCDNADCEAIVAALDPFCVNVAWDGICANEAIEFCVGEVCDP